MKTLYSIFGVPEDADQETINKAWKKLMKSNPPDVNPGIDPRIPQEINRAYSILADPTERQKYDAHLANLRRPQIQWNWDQMVQWQTGTGSSVNGSNTTINVGGMSGWRVYIIRP